MTLRIMGQNRFWVAVFVLLTLVFVCNNSSKADSIEYGPQVSLSSHPNFKDSKGQVRSFIRYDSRGIPLEVGMEFNPEALDKTNLPEDLSTYTEGEFLISLPDPRNPTVFNLLTWTWVAGPNGGIEDGHGPAGVYDIEHFDFHFYLNTQEVRDTINVLDSSDEYAKAITLPAEDFWPVEYKRPIDDFGNAIGVAPGDGSHWNNAFGPEFAQPPSDTHVQFFEASGNPFGPGYTIQYGAFDGIQTLLEPMVTPDFLRSKQNAQVTIPQPQKYFKTGYFPTIYEIRYAEGAKFPHQILLKDFVFHEANPLPERANEAPTDIILNNTTIYDNSGFLTLVGSLQTTDPHGPFREVDDHVYALPFGIGGSGLVNDADGRFFVTGNQIRVSDGAELIAEESYEIVVRSVDTGGLDIEVPIEIKIDRLPGPLSQALSEQGTILLQGVEAWNRFRERNPDIMPDLEKVSVPPIVSSPFGPTSFSLIGANLRNADLRGAILELVDLSSADLRGAILEGAFMFGANLNGADLRGADLKGADLSSANLAGANLENANLSNAFLIAGAVLTDANLSDAILTGADLITANLSEANLQGANLEGASLRLTNVTGANLGGANLKNANLFGVDLDTAASLEGAVLPSPPRPPTELQATLLQGSQAWNQFRLDNSGASLNLSGIDIPPTNFDLSGANLSGTNLSNAFLEFVNFSGSDLSGADLSGSRLFGANLSNVNLKGANLTNAFLIGTNLSNTDLSGSNLDGAILSGSTLDGTNLQNTSLKNTQFRFINQTVSRQIANGEIAPANFVNADLTGAAFRLAILRDANFIGANLKDAADIFGADFTGAQFE
jgi:uncharacterized protein YjbI with pentapeptide repeats